MTDRCPKCKAWVYYHDKFNHKCLSLWLVQCSEYDDEWKEIYASEESYAAESWAEEYDADSHDMMDGETIVVRVKPHEDNTHYNMRIGNVKTFECSGEAVATYYASEIDDDRAGDSDG